MRQVIRYGGAGLLALILLNAGLWPWLSSEARRGLLVAALIAFPVQVVAFALLVRFRKEAKRFLLVWMGGTVVRMGIILLAGVALTRVPTLPPAPTLLALAGFFFGLLLLEPLFLRPRGVERTETTR